MSEPLYPVSRGSYVPSDEALSVVPTRFAASQAQPKSSEKLMFSFSTSVCGGGRRRGTSMIQRKKMTIGTVKFFNTSKGFGFISPEGGGKDVFVHATAVEAAGLRTLSEGQKVSFDIQPDARGSKAANLKAV
jgi:CspA family cold shock protein